MPLPTIYQELERSLLVHIDAKRIFTEPAQLLAFGTDASFYRLLPKMVLRLNNVNEVMVTLQHCLSLGIACTFRAAGTSLSGQALSDAVLITLSDNWRGYQIKEAGKKIALQPGVIGADANKYLQPYGRKIGPDPASINTCKIGGIAANNASGMCCGTAHNSYQTVASMQLILADGTSLDTGNIKSVARFKLLQPQLISGIEQLTAEVSENDQLTALIHHKYRLKNTTGYALNAFIDYQDPIDIIQHLMIGSEGTLGFISEITYNTVVEHPCKATALFVFSNIDKACQAVSILDNLPVSAVEIMDGRAMQSIAKTPGMPTFINELSLHAAVLLIESHAHDQGMIKQQCDSVTSALSTLTEAVSIPFTSEPAVVDRLWAIRKGLFPSVGAVREVGTTVIIEDIAVPIASLAAAVSDLQNLFLQFQYHHAIIFGHALAGNLHFVFTQSFESESEIERYRDFMAALTELVAVKYDGSLKAEHGTGRNMAPFITLEWGEVGYRLMQKIKQLFDPKGLLNPGVIINDNPQVHIQNLKPIPQADPLIDRCIECGFCEPVCPARTLTLSPRQRIVLYREIKRCEQVGDTHSAQLLTRTFEYHGINTCAATGLCEARCPVGINTGELIKKLRQEKYQQYKIIARWTANHFSSTSKLVKLGLRLNNVIQDSIIFSKANQTRMANALHTAAALPRANTYDLHPGEHFSHHINKEERKVRKAVYFTACPSRIIGEGRESKEIRTLPEVTLSLLKKSGFHIIIPDLIGELCCGQAYESKGFNVQSNQKSIELEAALWAASEQGKWPILIDTSPCTKRCVEQFSKRMEVLGPTEFVVAYVLQYLTLKPLQETVMLHVTCSTRRQAVDLQIRDLAKLCAARVIEPEFITCCAWAGDKGVSHPELNTAALAPLKSQIPNNCTRGYSDSLTCEIGLSKHSGIHYQSILYLVDEVSVPRKDLS